MNLNVRFRAIGPQRPIPDDKNRERALANVAYTLQVGRKHFLYRIAIAYSGYDELLKALSDRSCKQSLNSKPGASNQKIVFGFSGQGTQYANMALDLYKNNSFFEKIVDDC